MKKKNQFKCKNKVAQKVKKAFCKKLLGIIFSLKNKMIKYWLTNKFKFYLKWSKSILTN